MTEFTLEPGSNTKLLTARGFLELLFRWADGNLDTIAKYWAMPGEGWEDSVRTSLAAFAQDDIASTWMDLGEPKTRAVYTTKKPKPKMADFVLNGSVAANPADRVIVEVKTQSIGRILNFTGDFEADIAKLNEVDDEHADCARLAVALFFTSDWSQSKSMGESSPVENHVVSTNFTKWLDGYDHVYFSETYKPIRRKARTQTAEQLAKAGTIYVEEGGEDIERPKGATKLRAVDVHELGIVYKILPSKNAAKAARRAAEEEAKRAATEARLRNQNDDDDFETPPNNKKRKAEAQLTKGSGKKPM
ncbi:hypothetical protein GCM10022226_83170 [Sphaerisporangium flaviroseum]|uniref:Uncharacterized protein n=1 Tax=Sphaerisporangium flaviroseum TaxID=509199 RepID=A0ABP7JM71_9ACTN